MNIQSSLARVSHVTRKSGRFFRQAWVVPRIQNIIRPY